MDKDQGAILYRGWRAWLGVIGTSWPAVAMANRHARKHVRGGTWECQPQPSSFSDRREAYRFRRPVSNNQCQRKHNLPACCDLAC